MQDKKTSSGHEAFKNSSTVNSRRSKDNKAVGKTTVRWNNKSILSSVASTATAIANKKMKKTIDNVVEMKGATLVQRDVKTGKFVKLKKIDPVIVSCRKMTLKINRK